MMARTLSFTLGLSRKNPERWHTTYISICNNMLFVSLENKKFKKYSNDLFLSFFLFFGGGGGNLEDWRSPCHKNDGGAKS